MSFKSTIKTIILSTLLASSVTMFSLVQKASSSALAQQQSSPTVTTPTTPTPMSDTTEPAQPPAQSDVQLNGDAADSINDDDGQQNLVDEGLADEPVPDTTPTEEQPPQPDTDSKTKSAVDATKLIARSSSPKRYLAMLLAKKQIGYTEGKNNCNKFSVYFDKRCQSWCGDFVSSRLDLVGDRNKKLPWDNPSSVSSILAWARESNQIVKQPAPGDLFIMKARGQSHVGFVESVKGNVFYTVEGNTTKPGNKRIQGVFQKARDMRKFPYIFVRVPARTQT